MLGYLIVKELQESFASKSFLLALSISIITFSISFNLMISNYHHARGVYNSTLSYWNQSGVSGKLTVQVGAPPCPLTIFASGSSSSKARPVTIGRRDTLFLTHKVNVDPKREQEDLVLSFFSVPDFLFTARILLSFLAILFSSLTVCREKEDGTLRLILSNSVKRATVVFAKWLSQFSTISFIFAFSFLVGLVQLTWSRTIVIDSGHWVRILLIFLVSLIFIAAYCQLGILISTWTRRSSTAMVSSMLIWALLVLIIPTLAAEIARFVRKVPNAHELQLSRAGAEREQRKNLTQQNGSALNSESKRQLIRKTLERIEDDYTANLFAQVKLAKRLAALSCAMVYDNCILTLAHNDLEDEYAYYQQLRYYATKIASFDKTRNELLAETDHHYLPYFNYVEAPFLSSAKTLQLGIPLLLGHFVLFSLLSFYSFDRYDVR